MKYLHLLTATAALCIATPAFAQDADQGTGMTFSLRTGVADLNNPQLSLIDEEGDNRIDTKLETKSGWLLAGEVGYDFGPVRLGLELSYNRNKVKGLNFRRFNGEAIDADDMEDFIDELVENEVINEEDLEGAELDGTTIKASSGSIAKIRQVGVMANIMYDIPAGETLSPYIGFGLGAVGTHLKALGEDDGSVRFAWQARAGVAFAVSPNVNLTADYTYRQTNAGNLQFGDSDIDYRFGKTRSSQFAAGVRFRF